MSGVPGSGGSGRGPLDDLAAVAAALDAPEGRATFLRGLTVGVLAGAALVGAVLQLRRRPSRAATQKR